MRTAFNWTLQIALFFAAGAVFGPLLIALVGAATLESDMSDRPNEATRLVAAYRDRLPGYLLFLTVISPENGRECGYKAEVVFPDADEQLMSSAQDKRYSEYSGYRVLDRWRNDTREEEWISAVTRAIDDDLSDFEVSFLRRCIEETLFRSYCMKRVAPFGNSAVRFDHKRPVEPLLGYGVEDQIVCTYVDGVAARRELPLAARD